ncbi:hypothetical protein B0T19DRAFT_246355 [Cercophora scortea]|uniref:Protamine P1 n=1 Tax=Cercophora scortea TaxID=314031 RepID=A0AAE0I922_9PEZI|nr:hypothetical protein B0T19DRAFT_246355 [Cercophora scortea]
MKRRHGDSGCEWLQPQLFGNEPICGEAEPPSNNEVLYSGSDDDAYADPDERRMRCEAQAHRFLQGKPMFLLSASLRGPFGKEHGWTNPWRSKSTISRPGTAPHNSKKRRISEAGTALAERGEDSQAPGPSPCHLPSPESATAATLFLDSETLGRVRHWRDTVVAEIQISSPSQQRASSTAITPTRPISPTEQTPEEPYFQPPGALDRGLSSPNLDTTKLGYKCASSPLARGLTKLQTPYQQWAPSQPFLTVEVPFSSSHNRLNLQPSEATDISPRTIRPTGLSTKSRDIDQTPPPDVQESSPTDALRTVSRAEILRQEHKADTSFRTRSDRSFRFRSKAAREKLEQITPVPKAAIRTGGEEIETRTGSDAVGFPDPGVMDVQNPEFDQNSESAGIVKTEELSVADDAVASGGGPRSEASSSDQPSAGSIPVMNGSIKNVIKGDHTEDNHTEDNQTEDSQTEEDHTEDDIAGAVASQIDGPTLVPSMSSTASEMSSMISMGFFSAEKQSQNLVENPTKVSGKLLWPRSQQNVKGPTLFRRPVDQHPSPVTKEVQDAQTGESPNHGNQFDETASMNDDRSIAIDGPVDQERATTGNLDENDQTSTGCENIEDQAAEEDAELASEKKSSSPLSAPKVQSPWGKADMEIALAQGTLIPPAKAAEDTVITQIEPRRSEEPVIECPENSPGQQSPWTESAEVLGRPSISVEQSQLGLDRPDIFFVAARALVQGDTQSPWKSGDSQIPIQETRLFNPLSSPANSSTGLPEITTPYLPPQPSSGNEDTGTPGPQSYPMQPSTPNTKQSSLPTPDFTLSIKSFKDFMTPSPKKKKKRRRVSTDDDRLPSTQALVDAAISNPWARSSIKKKQQKKKKAKKDKNRRVSWAPLPGEETAQPSGAVTIDPRAVSYATDSPAGGPTPNRAARGASPPPPGTPTTSLPAGNQKFSKHFAAMANRRARACTPRKSTTKRLLPSASQQTCESPAIDAMAKAFLQADEQLAMYQGRNSSDQPSSSQIKTGMGQAADAEDTQDDDEEEEDGYETQPESVDDVTEVLDNLSEFLDSWDVDAELAKARAVETRAKTAPAAGVLGGDDGAGIAGLMDHGVWDL